MRAWADDARTTPLSVAELGFQAAENFCTSSPRPSPCSTTGLAFEAPVWVTSAETFDGTDYVPGTLRGNTLRGGGVTTLDSAGAYGWFAPTTQIRVLEVLFGARDGFPVFSLTMAAPAPKVTISGTVASPTGVPAGTQVALQNADGTPVLDTLDQPVLIPVGIDGSYTIETEQRPSYLLDPVPPPGFVDPAAFAVTADTAAVTAPPVELVAVPAEPEVVPPDEDPAGQLAVSGAADIFGVGLLGLFTLVAGSLVVVFTRSASTASRRR